MDCSLTAFILFLTINIFSKTTAIRYEPTWKSIDSRPLPKWYDDAKIGIFIHWGVYSVPSYGSERFWYSWKRGVQDYVNFINNNYRPGFAYQEFAKDFTAQFYDPEAWAKLFKKSGAKYVVITSKHHEGYALWPSTYSFSWNAHDVGPHRDLIGDLANAIRKHTDLTFGLYHSLFEWFNPMYLSDKASNLTNTAFVKNKVYPELLEIVHKYKPEIIWSDGEGEAPDTYWKSKEFISWLYNHSPVKNTVVTNDRWGSNGVVCKHGDFFTCADRFNPGVLQPHKWENAMKIDKRSWGYRLNARIEDYMTSKEILVTMAQTVSCRGNLLINVGPTKDGIITPIFQERLLDLGKWLSINGEAIYGSKPWTYQNDTLGNTWYTSKKSSVYAIILDWPDTNLFEARRVIRLFRNRSPTVTLLGNSEKLKWVLFKDKVQIELPSKSRVISEGAWVLKINDFELKKIIKWFN